MSKTSRAPVSRARASRGAGPGKGRTGGSVLSLPSARIAVVILLGVLVLTFFGSAL